ncbi:MAG: sigma-54 dependent transcriptional regulator [Planctomycetes bacterium]|nr:sigma-54 dependent transcriptional regulator [Planctomycetota bacterium]
MNLLKFPSLPVLIVDDELEAIRGCELTLNSGGINNTLRCQDPRETLPLMEHDAIGVVVLDLTMPYISGQKLLVDIVQNHPEVPVIILTGKDEVETSVKCMRKGAFDYMVKPVEESRMVSGIRRAIEFRELQQEYKAFKTRIIADELEHPEAFSSIVTRSPKMRALFQYIETVARTNRPVLITGETGVGKELIARALHELSEREGRLVPVNVAGLDDNVFSDTLFGHIKGAYTGADEARPGLIAQAAGGNLFLDEIGDLSPASQVKLLRLLQDQEYLPLGSDMPKKTDARIIVATNRDLKALQESRQFRMDLYYRLVTHHIHLPPLRERMEDLPLLVDHLMEKAAEMLNKKKPAHPKELLLLLGTYGFPGNIRELETMVMDAMSFHKSGVLSMEIFKRHLTKNHGFSWNMSQDHRKKEVSPFAFFSNLPTLKEAQRLLIEEALSRAKGNQSLAARHLGITQSGLSKALKRERMEADGMA